MSASGVPSLPPSQLTTTITTVEPPRPLPELVTGSASQVQPPRVPYPSVGVSPSLQSGKAYKTKRTFKVIILGNAGVGKTCLRFPAQTEATIGVDFRERSVVLDHELCKVQLWDTAGQERYRQSIVAHYYRNVSAVVFVYDVGSRKSFEALQGWIEECSRHAKLTGAEGEGTPRILIGNKCDLQSTERVPTDVAQRFADSHDMALFETSALADSEADHVESIFMTLVHKLHRSQPMHVQSEGERQAKEQQTLLLRADEAAKLHVDEEGWCC